MAALDNLQKLSAKKQQEIKQLEMKLREANAYLQALQDSIRVLNREESGEANNDGETTLRPGTSIAQAHDVLKASGKPLHINDLLQKMGKTADKKSRLSLSGSLAAYVREGQIFTRTGPNTFGLIEFGRQPVTGVVVPAEFGKV